MILGFILFQIIRNFNRNSILHSWFRAPLQLFQNKHQQDDTYGLSFISRLVVLYSTCFELQGKSELLMMSSLKLETFRVKDD